MDEKKTQSDPIYPAFNMLIHKCFNTTSTFIHIAWHTKWVKQ